MCIQTWLTLKMQILKRMWIVLYFIYTSVAYKVDQTSLLPSGLSARKSNTNKIYTEITDSVLDIRWCDM